MRCKLLIAIILVAGAASAAEAPYGLGLTAMLLGANDEIGGVDEVDTYPPGLPEDVEPEVLSPQLRPERPAEPPPPPVPEPEYRVPVPPIPQPPVPGYQPRAEQYRTVLEARLCQKNSGGLRSGHDAIGIKFLFRRVAWKTEGVPTDYTEEWAGAGNFSIGGVPPDSGEIELPGMPERWHYGGFEAGLKVYLSDQLPVEAYGKARFYGDLDPDEETLLGGRVGFAVTKKLTLWYGQEMYEQMSYGDESSGWYEETHSKDWPKYGVDWLFEVRNQQFMFALERCGDAPRNYFLLGPLPTDVLEFSWFPYQQLRVSLGFKNCPGSLMDSRYLRAKWDISKTFSVGCRIEDGTGDSDLEVRVFSAALRF